ncbi:MAG: TspO/MBR family protein [Propionicimonas sp.]|uniref:TspO/MBR family protein n=1 Tax=Propionicimonas sp. TaxID=1955623 RepID=UPI003D109D12
MGYWSEVIRKTNRTRWLRNLALTGSMVGATVVAGTLATDPQGQWYEGLSKPDWQPPREAFPIVWTALYADIALTSAAALTELERRGDEQAAADFRKALVVNLVLNGAWSWLFFRSHNLAASAIGAGVLAASSIQLARNARRAGRRCAVLLAPYALWTSFATVLAAVVWQRNPNG